MIRTSIEFDPADVARFCHQLRRLSTELGMAPEDGVRVATISFARSMIASTVKGKSVRKVTPERIRRVNLRNGKSRAVKVGGSFLVEKWNRDGTVENVRIFAASLAEAKASKAARIRYAGLARVSWGWALQRLFGTMPPAANVRRPVRPFMAVSKGGRGRDFEVSIENTLDYVSQSLSGGRGPAVSTAMSRAANTLRARIDRRITRATR